MAARNLLMKSNLLPRYSVEDLLTKEYAEELAEEAVQLGSCPFLRGKVQVIGDTQAGKTSLCKNLRNEPFNPREDPTVGLHIKKCRITPEDKEWRTDTEDAAAELDQAKEWYILNKIASQLWSGKHITKTMLLFSLCCFALIPLIHGVWLTMFGSCLVFAGRFKSMPMLVLMSWVLLGRSLGYGQTSIMNAIWLNRIFTFIYLLISYTDEILAPSHPALIMIGLALMVYTLGYLGSSISVKRIQCLTILIMRAVGLWVLFNAADNYCLVAISQANETEFFILLLAFAVGVVTAVCGMLQSQMANIFLTVVPIVAFDTENAHIAVAICGFVSGGAFVIGTVHGRSRTYCESSFDTCLYVVLVAGDFVLYCTFDIFILEIENPFNITVVLNILLQLVGLIFVVVEFLGRVKLPLFGSVTLNDLFQKLEFLISNDVQTLERPMVLTMFDLGFRFDELSFILSENCISIVAFDITKFLKSERREKEFQRILYWLQSIRTSTKSSIVLVGTHIDQTNEMMVSDIQEFFKSRLKILDENRFRITWNGNKPFFGIDNSRYLKYTDDSCSLRSTILELTTPRSLLETMVPIRWLKFLIRVQKMRKEAYENQSLRNLVTNVKDLKSVLSDIATPSKELFNILRYFLNDESLKTQQDLHDDECLQILQYFHDVGEIYKNGEDKSVSPFVVLSPSLLPNIVQSLYIELEPTRQDKFSDSLQLLKHHGLLEHNLAKYRIGKNESPEFVTNVLILLEGIGIISKVTSPELPADEASPEDFYIVPTMLPKGKPVLPPGTRFTHHYYFDFGEFTISALFPRLLARCQNLSDLPCQTQGQPSLYRDGGLFTFSQKYFFRLLRIQHSATQNLIEVAIKVAHDGDPIQLLHHIWKIIKKLQEKEFPGIEFHCGPICPHEISHQRVHNDDEENLHILDVADSDCFPASVVMPMCFGRETEDTTSYHDYLASTAISVDDHAIVQDFIDVKGDNNIVITNSTIHTLVVGREDARPKVDSI